jgi:hypothetical protein
VAFTLPRIPRGLKIANPDGTAAEAFMVFWDRVCTTSEAQEGTQDDLIAAIQTAQADILTAQADITAAEADIVAVQADIVAVQADVAAIEVPPTGSRTVTTTQALSASDYAILADASAGGITLTLPLAATAENSIVVTKIDATANPVNIASGGSDQINDSGLPVAIIVQYASRTFNSDGTADWYG